MDESEFPAMARIEELVARVFNDRNAAHLAHWTTGSYAQHVPLGDFYKAIIETIDKIVECFQADLGKISDLPTIPSPMNDNITQQLMATSKWIEENANSISEGMIAVGNLIAELQTTYKSPIYKLNNLI